MNHANMYAVGLALCTFANIASEEMSRDLANEVEKLLGSTNTYIRKKVRERAMCSGEPLPISFHRQPSVPFVLCARYQSLRTTSLQKPRTYWRIEIMASCFLQSHS